MALLKFGGVFTASGVSTRYWPGLCYGDLQRMGYLSKMYRRGMAEDCHDIVWRVIGDIEFTDTHGHTWKQGDEIVWEK